MDSRLRGNDKKEEGNVPHHPPISFATLRMTKGKNGMVGYAALHPPYGVKQAQNTKHEIPTLPRLFPLLPFRIQKGTIHVREFNIYYIPLSVALTKTGSSDLQRASFAEILHGGNIWIPPFDGIVWRKE
jgi:hypothetical protein